MGYTVYAVRGASDFPDIVASLGIGEGRFGYSSIATADLRALRTRVEEEGWLSLSPEEQASYYVFLLDLKEDDYVVYVDIPNWGECAVARVTGEYFWRFDDPDFNHRFPVDPQSVFVFDRNGRDVHPTLSSRLRTQRVWWRISLKAEFEELLSTLRGGAPSELPPESKLAREIQPILLRITHTIHHTYAGKSLEDLCAEVFRHLPAVSRVEIKYFNGNDTADLLVHFASGLPLPGVERDDTLIVQVKAHRLEHWDTVAVEDMRVAFSRYPEASMGLLVSTAAASTPVLDAALEKLRRESGKHVALLIGEDIAAFLLQHAKVS